LGACPRGPIPTGGVGQVLRFIFAMLVKRYTLETGLIIEVVGVIVMTTHEQKFHALQKGEKKNPQIWIQSL